MVGGLGLLTARTITRPVQQLVDTTRAIRAGDLSKRVGLRTPDELGELATSFDHMTNQLVKRNKEIHTLYLQQLEQTAHREAILTSIGDAVIVQDLNGEIILRNLSAKTLLDRLQQDRIGLRNFGELRRTATTLSAPQTIELADNFFSVLGTPVCMPDGSLLGHVIVFRDVTAFVEAERLKDELIMQLSHELRTPLTVARGYTDLVNSFESHNLSEQGSRFIQSSLDNLTILERMINQVVDVSAIISNRFAVRIKSINLAEVLEKCVEAWKPLASQRELTLTLLLPSTETFVEGDANYLFQVFDHLLRNAVNYTLSGGTVEVYAAIKDDYAVIYVQDSGVGIAPDELDKVFERLYRGHSADAGPTDARGLGLGLYLSKHIVEAHHGTIYLKSKLDFGTVVTVELPVRQGNHL
jgi:signal transduction histidine kinase